ncbi:MAG: hypothetical protein H0U56_02825 [Methylibium sp.]|nr:hypothetical protein [Methylibium sp.]
MHRRANLHGLEKAFGERYLYAGLGSTFALGATPRVLGARGSAAPPALNDDDLAGYRALLARSSERRGRLFANLRCNATPGGAYLAQFRTSMVGCC